jgi:hypothetical protein
MIFTMSEFKITSLVLIIVGLLMGAMSWGVVSLVSNRFEPYDSELGFYIGQFILSVTTLFVGFRLGFRFLCIYTFSAYLGMNGYAYILGSGDSKAYALLGLVVSLILVVYPVLAGLLGYFAGRVISRRTSKQL